MSVSSSAGQVRKPSASAVAERLSQVSSQVSPASVMADVHAGAVVVIRSV